MHKILQQDETRLRELAKAIHDKVFRWFFDFKTSIFLCGAGKDTKGSVREQIDLHLRDWRFFLYRYDLVYPEDLFDELLYGENHQDLITLENILAESVDAIILVIESFGAVAELGSFASNSKLRKKLICIVDGEHKTSKSFINYGPLRLLKDKKEGEIIYGDFKNVSRMSEPIRKAITKVSKNSVKSTSVTNVLQAHHYILPCVFLLEPVDKILLSKLVMYASDISEPKAKAITTAALSMLIKKRELTLNVDGYRLTYIGQKKFSALGRRSRHKSTFKSTTLDALRISILNCQFRNKMLIINTK
jgi:hypothetical protein